MKPAIAIVGAGLGGLVLARVLYRSGVSVKVYESEASTADRTQGGQLDIHENTGQLAMQNAGLLKELLAIIHEGAEASRVLDHKGTLLLQEGDDGRRRRPEVLRGDLRQVLLDSLPDGVIEWGKKLSAVTPLSCGRHELQFSDGATAISDVLVGADGCWSQVRALLSHAKPQYVGTTFIETYLHDVDAMHSAVARVVGAGSMIASLPGKGISAQREAGNVIHVYVQLKCTLDWLGRIDFVNSNAAIAQISSEFADWAPELVALVAEADTKLIPRPIYALPVSHRWERVPGVTLIGDAAHVMPPSGDGANLAMLDGAHLGRAIAMYSEDVESALSAYEAQMFKRSEIAAANARKVMELCLGDRAPFGLVEFLNSAGEIHQV